MTLLTGEEAIDAATADYSVAIEKTRVLVRDGKVISQAGIDESITLFLGELRQARIVRGELEEYKGSR